MPATKLAPLPTSLAPIKKKKKKKQQVDTQLDERDEAMYLDPDDAIYFN